MGKLKFLCFSIALFTAFSAKAVIINVNIDYKTLGQWYANIGSYSAYELFYNSNLKTVLKKQEGMVRDLTTMLAERETHMNSLRNIDAFKEEGIYYKIVFNYSKDIISGIPKIYSQIGKSKFVGKATAIARLNALLTKTYTLVSDFCGIVANGKIRNPFFSNDDRNDGLNLLDRNERLKMTTKIIGDLSTVRTELNNICFLLEYATGNDLMREVDMKTYYAYFGAKFKVDEIVDNWKRL